MSKEKSFRFWVPAEISKATDKEGNEKMCVKGIASTSAEDTDGEHLDPKGFDLSLLKSQGYLNWHHGTKENPTAIIGEPTKAEIVKKGLYIEGELYKDSPMAKKVWQLAQILEKNSKTRRLGFSVEGRATERDKANPNIVTKAEITGCAITYAPKNPHTLMEIMKGQVDATEEDEFEITEETMGGKNYIVDITKEDGTHITLDKNGNITFKAASPTTAKPKGQEVLENGAKKTTEKTSKTLSKAEVFDKIFSDNPDITIEKSKKVYNIIQKISTMAKEKTITNDSIKKAYATLGLTDTETVDTIEKASDTTVFKKFKKGDTSYFRKFNKAAAGGALTEDDEKKKYKEVEKGSYAPVDEEVKKADKDEEEEDEKKDEKPLKKSIKKAEKDKDEEEEEGMEKAEEKDEDEEEEKEKKVEKSDDKDDDEKKDDKVSKGKKLEKAQSNDIEKAIQTMTASNQEMFKSVGLVLKDIKEKQETFQKGITEQLEAIQSSPNSKKSITKAIPIEKFGKNEETGATVLSASKHKKAVLDVLERVSFSKGFDNEFANAMTKYESSGEISKGTINRLMQEHKIQIVQ